jgi:hypothetical protein
MSFFLFYKIGEQENGTGPAWEGCTSRKRDEEYGANTVYTCL